MYSEVGQARSFKLHACRLDLLTIFPDAQLHSQQVTLLNVYLQKNETKKTESTEDIETVETDKEDFNNRADAVRSNSSRAIDNLNFQFALFAKSICEMLKELGYWGDFIDSNSGVSRLSDDSYRRMMEQRDDKALMGFDVQDNGHCKV